MAEYIKREDAIEAFYTATGDGDKADWAVGVIKSIPFADVRPVVHGKWKYGVCQICFFDWSDVAPFASVPNFCPPLRSGYERERR